MQLPRRSFRPRLPRLRVARRARRRSAGAVALPPAEVALGGSPLTSLGLGLRLLAPWAFTAPALAARWCG